MRHVSLTLSLGILALLMANCRAEQISPQEFQRHRLEMVKHQIEERGIHDAGVLGAMRKIERHRFVGLEFQEAAYEDHPLPIGSGQTISQPYIVALMTEVLDLDSAKTVLEIGTGSGYQAAVLAEICRHVFSIEIIESLGKSAQKLLGELEYRNISVKIGDGYQGWKEHAPFDAILVTCAPSHVPLPLQEQLAEGGKMVIPVGEDPVQELVLLKKENGLIRQTSIVPVRFVPMVNEKGKGY